MRNASGKPFERTDDPERGSATLSDGGEMGAALRSFDWASTPLGPMADWPQSLKVAVGICMNSRFPMFVWWGPDLINIYNDAYIPVLGKRHPEAFGRPAVQIWAEIWDVLGPQAEAVMRRGEATWNERVLLVMERKGYTEETYFTWSYSPIPDGHGGVGGLFCACTEETQRVRTEAERDRLLAELDAERDRLAKVFKRSPSFMAVLRGPEHVFELANDRYYQLVGHRDIVGRPVREALPEIAGQGFFELLDRVYETGEAYVGGGVPVMVQRQPDQPLEERYLEFVFQPTRGADGSVSGIFIHGVDLTEYKLATSALRQSERRFRFLSDLGEATRDDAEPERVMATVARKLGEHLHVSRCAYADVEADSERFTIPHDYTDGCASTAGDYHLSLFGPRAAADQRAGRTLVVHDVDAELAPDAGAEMFNAIGIKAIVCCPLVREGRLVAMMAVHQTTPRRWTPEEVGLVEAVVERSWAYIERARSARALARSEAEFRLLADAMPQIVWAARPDGHVDYYNRQWYEYTGVGEDRYGDESWGSVLHPEDLGPTRETWVASIRTGRPYEIELRIRRRSDGAYRWFLGRATTIRDGSGNVLRWFGTNTDIHDRKELQARNEQLLGSERAARGEAERTSRVKDEFLATLSHELRTPLNAILGWSQILTRSGGGDAEDLAEGLRTIERNARAQAEIIGDLLDMSRIISGKVRLDVQRLDLASVVRGAVETARPAADGKGVRLQVVLDPRAGPVSGDPNRLQQVFWNLLSNAIKFTPRGGGVQVVLERVNSHLEIGVIDTGEGIKPEFLPHVFDRFRQADASTTRKHGGLGLGLAIVKQLVELHGGTIRVKSAGEGRGAAFTVSLPLTIIHPEPFAEAERRHPRSAAAMPASLDSCADVAGVKVLVVDDEPDARALVKRLLEDCHAVVKAAASAAEALELFDEYRPDVLLSDVGLPGEDGYSLIRRVRALGPERGGGVPAVALTAYARSEDRTRSLLAGFQMHVAKPVEPAELIAMIASLAGRAGRGGGVVRG